MGPRLCELMPRDQRERQEAGVTQPRNHLIVHLCTLLVIQMCGSIVVTSLLITEHNYSDGQCKRLLAARL